MSTPSEQKRPDPNPGIEVLLPELISPSNQSAADFNAICCPESLVDYVSHSVLGSLPNDLTRMIYLASLRDCNSGLYLHPEISRERGQHAADRAFQMCHEEIFRQLL